MKSRRRRKKKKIEFDLYWIDFLGGQKQIGSEIVLGQKKIYESSSGLRLSFNDFNATNTPGTTGWSRLSDLSTGRPKGREFLRSG